MVIVSLFSGDCNTVLPHRNRKNHTPFSRIKKNTQDLKQDAIFSVIYFRCKLAGVRLLLFTAGIKELILLPKNMTQVKDRAGVPRIRFHDLRHSFATLSLEQGMDIKTVSHMLGHTDAGFTMNTYMHVTDSMQENVANTMENLLGGNVANS